MADHDPPLDQAALQSFAQIRAELAALDGPTTLKKVLRLTAYTRGKPVRCDRYPLIAGITAFCVALVDCDLIRVCSDADTPLYETCLLHECVHLLANHLPSVSLPMTYQQFQELSAVELAGVYHRHRALCRGDGFTHPHEFLAEKIAALLVDYLAGVRESIPWAARRVYGY
jgi:hypothetical protein